MSEHANLRLMTLSRQRQASRAANSRLRAAIWGYQDQALIKMNGTISKNPRLAGRSHESVLLN